MAADGNDAVRTVVEGDVAIVAIDDGKANALSHQVIDAIAAGLDRAERDAGAVVLAGRPGRFCAGFDLSVMQGGPEGVRDLVRAGAELTLRIYTFPRPVVVACTGHALAAGAILLMAADVRIGASGDYKIGLNEVAIGMPVPVFATELARDRLSRRHLTAATSLARIYDPPGALDAGYLDALAEADEVLGAAIEQAATLAGSLKAKAFEATRANLRGATAERVRATLAEDLGRFFVEAEPA